LPNAGKYIGWLERFLIITFILVNNYNGIGFILAAKGILRFGEIRKARIGNSLNMSYWGHY